MKGNQKSNMKKETTIASRLDAYVQANSVLFALAYICDRLASAYSDSYASNVLGLILRATVGMMWAKYQMERNNGQNRLHKVNSSEEEPVLPQVLQTLPIGLAEAALIYYLLNSNWLIQRGAPYEGSLWLEFVYFIPKSLAFELVYDFFYYWVHRVCHTNKTLYTWVHHHHHEHEKPGPLSTFRTNLLEYTITVLIPTLLSYYLIGIQFTRFQFQLTQAHKLSQEIFGHSGIDDENWFSFMQLPVLPEIFNLRSRDHDLHHSRNTINYSKRFKIWDVVFGTFDSLDELAKKRLNRFVNFRLMALGMVRNRRLSQQPVRSKEKLPNRRITVLNTNNIQTLADGSTGSRRQSC